MTGVSGNDGKWLEPNQEQKRLARPKGSVLDFRQQEESKACLLTKLGASENAQGIDTRRLVAGQRGTVGDSRLTYERFLDPRW